MSSIRRLLASQANGALSRGPKTPEGKARSSQNALRHGLLAHQVLLQDESRENFQIVFQQHVDRLDPADGMEYGMVEEMASSYWRLRRAWAIETRMLDNAADSQPTGDPLDRLVAAFTHPDSQKSLATLHRYESRLHLMYQRALHTILLLKAASAPASEELPNEPKAISEHSTESPTTPPQEALTPDPAIKNPELPNEPNPIAEHQEVGQAPWPARVPPDPHPAPRNEPSARLTSKPDPTTRAA